MNDASRPECDLSVGRTPGAPPTIHPYLLPVETWLGGGMAVLEADGRLITANDALAAWLGTSPAAMKGQFFAKLMGQRHPDWEPALEKFINRAEGCARLELAGNNGAGPERLTIEICTHGRTRFLHFESITRQTIAERRLLNMSWRENLGILTMGLAHDFCNMMTGIVGLSETFEGNVEMDSAVRSGLGLIRETAMQASQLAHRIRQLHQGLPGEKSYYDLNESVRGFIDLLQKVLPRRVRVLTDLASGQLPLYVDPVELQQVIINLALNAADAMPEGGQLTFRTRRHEQVPATQNLQGSRPRGPVISLSVRDTGTGIPARFLGSIFDPFFTTKPMGKGSGLGLYNARLFVEKHGSAISVETQEGAGSTFHLWFTEADFTQEQEVSVPQRAKPGSASIQPVS
jgi:signal transduction histidine kinase